MANISIQAVHRKIKSRLVNIQKQKPHKDDRKDLMADLIQLHKDKPEFTATYLHRMAITNFGAGHETTCSALTAAVAMLGSHPGVQARAAREQRRVAAAQGGRGGGSGEDGGSSSSTSSNQRSAPSPSATPYTLAAIKEAQRLYPVIGMSLPREVPAGGASVHGAFLPAGTTAGCNPASLHRNKDIFGADAHFFNPDRWLPTAGSAAGSSGSSLRVMERCNLTWGGGARTCPGRHLAELIVHRAVSRLVQEFEIVCEISPDEDLCFYFMAMLTGVMVRFSMRVCG
jgi:cytochrome P450